jgi:hypothetical protein
VYRRIQTRLAVDLFSAKRMIHNLEKVRVWTKVIPLSIEEIGHQTVRWLLKTETEELFYLNFHLMRCGIKTEYCTEVHLVIEMRDSSQKPSPLAIAYAENILESLRFKTNRDWIIKDSELTAEIFKSN